MRRDQIDPDTKIVRLTRCAGRYLHERMADAVAALPATGGVIDARGLGPTQEWGDCVTIDRPVDLILPPQCAIAVTAPMFDWPEDGHHQLIIRGGLRGKTVLNLSGAGQLNLTPDVDDYVYGCRVSDLVLNSTSSTVTPFRMAKCAAADVARLDIYGPGGGGTANGIEILNCGRSNFYDLFIHHSPQDGVNIDGDISSNGQFTNVWAQFCGRCGIHLHRTVDTSTGGWYFTNCGASQTESDSWHIERIGATGPSNPDAITCTACCADWPFNGHGLYVEGWVHFFWNGGWVQSGAPFDAGKAAVCLKNCQNFRFTGSYIQGVRREFLLQSTCVSISGVGNEYVRAGADDCLLCESDSEGYKAQIDLAGDTNQFGDGVSLGDSPDDLLALRSTPQDRGAFPFVDPWIASAVTRLTLTGNPADEDLVVLGTNLGAGRDYYRAYRCVDILAAAYDVLRGDDAAESLVNLKAAVNAEAGEGALYGTGTLVHPYISCTATGALTADFAARAPGVVGNAMATTTTIAGAYFGPAATPTALMYGGGSRNIGYLTNCNQENSAWALRDQTYLTLLAAFAQSGLLNLYGSRSESQFTLTGNVAAGEHITVGATVYTAGTDFAVGAAPMDSLVNFAAALASHPDAISIGVACLPNGTAWIRVAARTQGLAGESIVTTTDCAHGSWTGATLSGGGQHLKLLGDSDDWHTLISGGRLLLVGNVAGAVASLGPSWLFLWTGLALGDSGHWALLSPPTLTENLDYTLSKAAGYIPSLPSEATTEEGSGAVVRAISPTITTPTVGDLTNMQHAHAAAGSGGLIDAANITHAANLIDGAKKIKHGNIQLSGGAATVTAAGMATIWCALISLGGIPGTPAEYLCHSCSGNVLTIHSSNPTSASWVDWLVIGE